MSHYRKKPVVIEAFEWDGCIRSNVINTSGLPEWFCKAAQEARVRFAYEDAANKAHLIIKTLEGDMLCHPGDYIIQGVAGELYPCKHEIFHKTYEEVK